MDRTGEYIQALLASRRFKHQVAAHRYVAPKSGSGPELAQAVSETLQPVLFRRGLYIYPLKALTRDQLAIFKQWCSAAPDIPASAAVYDGDTSAYRRKKIRSAPPSVLMTNPEMVHLALLPFHAKWETFFRNLEFVVIEEYPN